MDRDATGRFSNRVADYVKYRPSYPADAVDHLVALGAGSNATVADIGSGTGILSALLVDRVATLYAVEPNAAMRAAAESVLAQRNGFNSVDGTAEHTTLSDASVDLIVAAQAYHWFERDAALTEFRRILREPKRVALLWNNRRSDTPFLAEYEALLQRYGTDYRTVNHQNITPDELRSLFVAKFSFQAFDNRQRFDLAGLKGRLFSSSYAPTAAQPGYGELIAGIEAAFDRYHETGYVTFNYHTEVYSGVV